MRPYPIHSLHTLHYTVHCAHYTFTLFQVLDAEMEGDDYEGSEEEDEDEEEGSGGSDGESASGGDDGDSEGESLVYLVFDQLFDILISY